MTIQGWIPLQSDGDDDQGASSDTQSCQMITFNTQDLEHSYESACSPESSSSSTSGVFEATAESPKPRKGDPKWVARPRNSFFIFRCEFIRDHSKGGRMAAPPGTAETLSKRAGEAWRRLTPEEKAHYERLAAQEKAQHVKDHPNYRYRPVRSDKTRKGRTPDPRTKHPAAKPAAKRKQSRRRIHSQSPPPQAEGTLLLSSEPEEQSSLTSSRRRSISVPPFSLLHTAFNPSQNIPVPGIRRASFESNQLVYPDGTSVRLVSEHDPSPMSGYISPAQSVDRHGYTMSPLAVISSSLANWNGEVDYTALNEPLPTSLGTQMWSSPAESFMGDASNSGSSHLQSPATLPMVYVPMTPLYPPNAVGIAQDFPHFAQPDCVQGTPMTNFTLDEATRALALQIYDAGLSERVNSEYLDFDMPISEEQRHLVIVMFQTFVSISISIL